MTSHETRYDQTGGGFPPPPPVQSDYETDYNAISEAAQQPTAARSIEELNLTVIQRHNPDITAIISIVLYSVVYLFSPESSSWEKSGIEGTLFICTLTPSQVGSERYGVIVLNRQGLENFQTELQSAEDVEITEEYVILQIAGQPDYNGAMSGPQIVGLWIYSEPPPSSTAEARRVNAEIIRQCASRAEGSRQEAEAAIRRSFGMTAE